MTVDALVGELLALTDAPTGGARRTELSRFTRAVLVEAVQAASVLVEKDGRVTLVHPDTGEDARAAGPDDNNRPGPTASGGGAGPVGGSEPGTADSEGRATPGTGASAAAERRADTPIGDSGGARARAPPVRPVLVWLRGFWRVLPAVALVVAVLASRYGHDAGGATLAAAVPFAGWRPGRKHPMRTVLDELHRGYVPALNPVRSADEPLLAVSASGEEISGRNAAAVRMAAAASRPRQTLNRAEFARWAGLADAELPPGFVGMVVLEGLQDRLLQEEFGQQAHPTSDLVHARIADLLVVDSELFDLLDRVALEHRRASHRFTFARWDRVHDDRLLPPRVPGLNELMAARTRAIKVAGPLIDRRSGAVAIAELRGWGSVPAEQLTDVLAAHGWLGQHGGSAWAIDPALIAAGAVPVVEDGQVVPRLDSDDPGRGALWLRGSGSSRHGGYLATLLHQLRWTNAGWAAPAGWRGPAHGEVVFGAMTSAWRHGRFGRPRRVAEDLYLLHADLDGPWASVFPHGVEFAVRRDREGRQWLDNFYRGPAIDASPRLADALDATFQVRTADSEAAGVRVGEYVGVTPLHVVDRNNASLVVGQDDLGFQPATHVRIELDELSPSHRKALTARWNGTVDFALIVADFPNLYGPGDGPAIAQLATEEPVEGTLLASRGRPGFAWKVNVGLWRRGQALIPTSPGNSGSSVFAGDLLAGMLTGKDVLDLDHIGGADMLTAPQLAELISMAVEKAIRLGLLPSSADTGPGAAVDSSNGSTTLEGTTNGGHALAAAAYGSFAWTTRPDAGGAPNLEHDAPFGVVVITDLPELADGAAAWIPGMSAAEREARVLELVAAATAKAPIALHEKGVLRVARVRFDGPVATMSWDGDAATREAELVTQGIGAGRHLVVGLYPIHEGAPAGLMAHPGLRLAAAQRSVVAIRDDAGRIIATGVVIEAATDSRPARVHVAYEVAELVNGRFTVDELPITGLRSVPHPMQELAEFSVWGLDRPAMPVRADPLRLGELVTLISHSAGAQITTQTPVVAVDGGTVETIAMLRGDVPGVPGFDAQGRIVMSTTLQSGGRIVGLGPEPLTAFENRIATDAARPVPPAHRRQDFGRPGPGPRQLADLVQDGLESLATLIRDLRDELPMHPEEVLSRLGDDPAADVLAYVWEQLARAPATAEFKVLAERADELRTEFRTLHRKARRAAEQRPGLGGDRGSVTAEGTVAGLFMAGAAVTAAASMGALADGMAWVGLAAMGAAIVATLIAWIAPVLGRVLGWLRYTVQPRSPPSVDKAVAQISEELGLTEPRVLRALRRAYQVAWRYQAPFITKIVYDMLPDLRDDVEKGDATLVFVGRDGTTFMYAFLALAPASLAARVAELVLPRAIVGAAVVDVYGDRLFADGNEFRPPAGKFKAEDVPGAHARLTDYQLAERVPVTTRGARITLVDSSFKGSIQVWLQVLYPAIFQGRYAFFGESPHDPHPGTKKGYEVHVRGDRLKKKLPRRLRKLFTHAQAIGALEDTTNGRWTSPTRINEDGSLNRIRLRDAPDPLAELNPALVAEVFTDPWSGKPCNT